MPNHPTDLRQQCRQRRRQLTPQQQIEHAGAASRIALRTRWLQRPKRIGLFLPQDGELDTHFLLEALLKRGHRLYLPVLQTLRGRPMAFAPYTAASALIPNRFRIHEPITPHDDHINAHQLDVLFAPLTCFDHAGHRLGMGGGFYDRSLAFKQWFPNVRPVVIGWAHECQYQPELPVEPWDQPLDALITETRLYEFRNIQAPT
ncbi:MAG: 5-formyltetrahydrofolate cyclo-ligase [Hydrogenovibrio sp.]|uniref:5-formyltetrahydrofolate cyclo-ligase n=1 Tax=Hydrogenovibrio sp. TaxID=2065821 RepID=UPI0028707300|nr:5-formyltetrahydrofolate cyclo-ligase [Hydrogenovibrio sp.]MDR9498658.1 5-formyltetrahydrofolate cyclo-ligase [Hydrogenovibrio sp.]